MKAKVEIAEKELIDDALAALRQLLPANWSIEPGGSECSPAKGPTTGWRADEAAIICPPNGASIRLLVEAKRYLSPRDAEQLFTGFAKKLRAFAPNVPILVIAPWLSPRTQELLAAERVNYIDLVGNVLLRLEDPAIFIQTSGSGNAPAPMARAAARVRGPKAGRLVRFLVDVYPPYRVSDIATSTGLAAGYVSRLLDTLDSEGLIERASRGQVVGVEFGPLLRRWAEYYDVFKANQASTFILPNGTRAALPKLAELSGGWRLAVTGSFSAARLAPVASPALLAIYTDDVVPLASAMGLLPTDEGANVVLLTPFDPVVYSGTIKEAGLSYTAPSQTAVDCLTGNGRMPAEGGALLAWMQANESSWRVSLSGATNFGSSQ